MQSLAIFWSSSMLEANLLIGLNLLGALALGMLVGYERAYNGRAAGIRTYGLISMASCALTVFVGHSTHWYGGTELLALPDATRVIQGIITGIGFLCAGVIMRDGFTINGLTTAASMWASSSMGILVGVGFYGASIIMALLSMAVMYLGPHFQRILPHRESLRIDVTFSNGVNPTVDQVVSGLSHYGYAFVQSSLVISYIDGHVNWKFTASSESDSSSSCAKIDISNVLYKLSAVHTFHIETNRN